MKNFDPDATGIQRSSGTFDPDATILQQLEGVDPNVTVLRTKKQRTSMLPGVKAQLQQISPEVSSLIEHRQNTVRLQTMALQTYVTQELEQEQATTVAMPQVPQVAAPVLPPSATSEQVQPGPKAQPQLQKPFWPKLRRRRVPVLNQMSMVECGAASLAMLMSYYGRTTSVSEVREHCGVGRDGLTALTIVKAARSYGMRVRVVSLKENDFRLVTLPAIIHWEFNHFLVLERWTPKYAELVDPAMGRRRVTAEEFDNGFTGVVIMLEPGVNFNRNSAIARVNLRSYAVNYIKMAPTALLQILCASFLLQLFGLALPLLTAVVIDSIIPSGMKDALVLLSIGFIILLLAQLVTTLLRASVLLYLQTRVDTRMILGFIEQLLSLPQRFFLQRSTGDILSRMSSNQVIRETISNQLVSTVLDGSFVVVYLLILLSVAPFFALLVVVLGLIQAVLLLTTNRLVRDLAKRELVAQGKSQGYLAEALIGISTLKAAGAEQRALHQWSNLFYDQLNVSVRRSYVSALIDTAMTTMRVFSPVLLLLVGTVAVLNGSLPLGAMLALNVLAVSFLTPLSSLVTSGQKLQLVHSHLERIADVMEAEPEQDIQSVRQPPRLTGGIRLENVHFQYDANSSHVLHDISVTIWPGQKVALVGKSGSGKSTLGNLLLGLYLPTKGQISYDNLPLQTLNYQAVRAQFGVVMQNSTIFSGSIRQNIALNNPEMTMQQVIKAAQAAAIHDAIMQMPMEYETFVSEGGSGLSGGQRQRIALARALASSPVILLLDEATSALDVLTEQVIERNLRALACTQVIIAHRLSTIRNADLILIIDEGTIVEGGTHQELVKRNGYYARLIQSQLASGEVKAL